MLVDVTAVSHEQLIALYLEREQEIATAQHEDQQRHRKELAASEATIAASEATIAASEVTIAAHEAQIAEYQFRIAKLERMIFGARRERFTVPDGQLVLPIMVDAERVTAAVEAERTSVVAAHARKQSKHHPGRLPLPEHLEVIETVLEPDVDTTGMTCIGAEVTNELGYTAASLFIKRTTRPKYVTAEADDASQHVYIAPMPKRWHDKCEAGTELIAAIITDKYISHLPVYRQLERFRALGVDISRSTADNWQRLAGNVLRPLYAALRAVIEQATYLQVDETGIAVQDRAKKGTTHRGYMWAYHAPVDRLIYLDYRRGRGAIHCKEMLAGFRGYLQTDGYAAYKTHKARDVITPLACWAHARRKFFDAQANDRERSQYALKLIGKLYDVERDARERALSGEERKELRLDASLPVVNGIAAWLANEVDRTMPKSPIGIAFRYAISLWDELENYLLDGNLEIDNNLIENAIRPIALGRKNWLFAGSHDAAINIAMYRSFFATCRANGIDERKWLLYVLNNIRTTDADKYLSLLPHTIDPSLIA